jgi:hypothetical protein
MHKLHFFQMLTCGLLLTVVIAPARAGDKADFYLKDGKLKERIEVLNDGIQTDGLGRSGSSIVVEPDGSWTFHLVGKDIKRQESEKGKLTREELAQLAKALAQHDLTRLPNHTGKRGFASYTTITFGNKSVKFAGEADSDEGKQLLARYRGIETAIRQLTVAPKAKK